ncbi:MAG TPA: EF-hand domain-containing protein [Burkholderiaceae bacterium]|nr:EF-hand domain-containing protein [Burkholderiaceae bacterium]
MKQLAVLVAALAFAGAAVAPVGAQSVRTSASVQSPLCDPCVPPALRNTTPAQPTEGAALQSQVEQKLRQSFDAADVRHTGALTREQARAAGLGVVANNFDQIDTAKTGKVTFEDLKRYLRSRGAKF